MNEFLFILWKKTKKSKGVPQKKMSLDGSVQEEENQEHGGGSDNIVVAQEGGEGEEDGEEVEEDEDSVSDVLARKPAKERHNEEFERLKQEVEMLPKELLQPGKIDVSLASCAHTFKHSSVQDFRRSVKMLEKRIDAVKQFERSWPALKDGFKNIRDEFEAISVDGVKCQTRHNKIQSMMDKFPATLVDLDKKLVLLAENVKAFKTFIDIQQQQQKKTNKKRVRRGKDKDGSPKKVALAQE